MKKLSDRPYNDFVEDNPETEFWTDGNKVFNRFKHLKGANPKTFLYDGIFAKDDGKCFCGETWLREADVETFRLLNYTYAIDKNNVYTITGKIKDADIDTFEVLDDGKILLWYDKDEIPQYSFQGYAKDKNNIYYHGYDGKPKIVKCADLKTFESMGDKYFAKDKSHIYGNGKVIKKANTNTWRKISEIQNSFYSKDDSRVFYAFWEINVDYETFELIIPSNAKSIDHQLAKDTNNFYRNGEIISAEEFERLKEK